MAKSQSASKRNERLTQAVSFLGDLAFVLPVWLLFGTNELGLSATTATALFMTLWIGSGLLEIPTGALADRLGRKRIYLIGIVLLSTYPIAYALKLSVPVIFLISLFAAFGSALRSGTLLALTHESFQQEGRSEKEYHKFLSTNKIYIFIARAVSGVTGGILYAIDPRWPFVAIFISYLAMFLAGLFIVDTSTDRSKLSNRLHIAVAIKAMKQKQIIRNILIIYVLAMLAAEAMWTGLQPLFESDDIRPENIGLIFSCIAVISALGAYTVRHLMTRIGVLKIEITVAVLMTIGAFLLFLPSTLLHILAVVPVAFAFGLTFTPIQATVQKHTPHKLHSTVLSAVSVLQYCVYGVASISVGFMIDVFGATQTRTILLGESVLILIFIGGYYLHNKDKDEIVTKKA